MLLPARLCYALFSRLAASHRASRHMMKFLRTRPGFTRRRLFTAEWMEQRLALTATAASTYRTLDLSATGSFQGSASLAGTFPVPLGSATGTFAITGGLKFTSPTVGTALLSGTAKGTATDVIHNTSTPFSYAASFTASVNNGVLKLVPPAGSDITHFFGGDPMTGTFNPSTYAIAGSGNVQQNGTIAAGNFTGTVVDKATTATDLVPTAKFTSTGVDLEVNVTGKFIHTTSMATPVASVAAYWSTTNTLAGKIGSAIALPSTANIYWDTGNLKITADNLGAVPSGAAYLLFQADPTGKVAEASETNNLVALQLPHAKLNLVVLSPASPVQGQDVGLGVQIVKVDNSVVPLPQGNVAFSQHGAVFATKAVDSTGFVQADTLINGVGSNVLLAHYVGSSFYTVADYSKTLTVQFAQTTTTLAVSTTSAVFGQPITLTATVKPVSPSVLPPTGTVTFFDGTTQIGAPVVASTNGVFKLTVNTLAIKTHSITAQFHDANYSASNTAATAVTVTGPADTTTTITPPAKVVVNVTAPFVVTVAPKSPSTLAPNNVTVDLYQGTTKISTGTLVNGKVTFNLKFPGTGTATLTAKFAAVTGYKASNSVGVNLTVVAS
jgi:hypothetical protein